MKSTTTITRKALVAALQRVDPNTVLGKLTFEQAGGSRSMSATDAVATALRRYLNIDVHLSHSTIYSARSQKATPVWLKQALTEIAWLPKQYIHVGDLLANC